jgi:hypothetical protein
VYFCLKAGACLQTAFGVMKSVKVTGIKSESEADLDAVADTIGMGLTAWGKIVEFQPRMLDALLHQSFKFEMTQVVNMRELLKQREEMMVCVPLPGWFCNSTQGTRVFNCPVCE